MYSQVASKKHRTDVAFQRFRLVKQGPDQTIKFFCTYIVATCKGADISDYNKRRLFWTRLCLEICAAILKDEDYLTFNACLDAVVEAETAFHLNAKYDEAFKSMPKDRALDKSKMGKGKPHKNSLDSRITQDASQQSHDGSCGHGHSSSRGGYRKHDPQGNRCASEGSGAQQCPGSCKACGKMGHWAQDCRINLPTNAALFSLSSSAID